MSHLRPNNANGVGSKPLSAYTNSERETAMTQVLEAERIRVNSPNAKAQPPADVVKTIAALSKGTNGKDLPHVAQIPEYITELLTESAKK